MQNYINLILDELQGDTPKQKYESLKKLQDERTTYWSKANHAHNSSIVGISSSSSATFVVLARAEKSDIEDEI